MSFYKNTIWSLLSIVGVQFINIVTNIVLARLLSPEYFGVLGMAMVFAGIAFVIQEAGLNSYLIYTTKLSKKIINATLLLNLILSILIAILIWVLSPLISNIFESNQVELVLKYVCLGIIISSFGSTSRALLMRERQFKIITLVDITAEIISSIFAILFAIYIDGILAISTKYIFRPSIQSILSFIIKPISFKDLIYIDKDATRDILTYSTSVLGSQMFMYANNNIDYFLVGKLLGKTQLGLYTIAFQWGSIARYYLASAVMRVLFPETSRWQDDISKVKDIYLDSISKLSLITLPICIGLALVSYEFIFILYGESWIEVYPVLQILLIAGGLASITVIGGPVLRGIGKPNIEMILSVISFVTYGILLLIFIKYGLTAVAFAELVRVLIVESARLLFLKKYLKIKAREIYTKLAPSLKSVMIMTFGVSAFGYIVDLENIYINFLIKILLGIIIYAGSVFYLDRHELKTILFKIKKR
ncbi:lipopolysaccharide biosynthesis protein [Rossellomorea vietnamensis]|uniref:lipopolysaccharide biosynthesis protein n=1 Tax=Rossellomorea vietnamensis TaxID=218284 RepID=UPI0020787043|nr:lipopolysaccharide biosynthesis protein [Rossellomorea vietnamensis]